MLTILLREQRQASSSHVYGTGQGFAGVWLDSLLWRVREDCPEQIVALHLEQGADRVDATGAIISLTPVAHLVSVGGLSFHSAFVIFHDTHALRITPSYARN